MPDSKTNDSADRTDRPRRINGLVLIGGLLLILVVTSYRPPVATVACNEDVLATGPDVIMLGAWWCSYCYQARKYFTDNNISYCEYDIEHTTTGKDMYQPLSGTGIPILFIGNKTIIGFDQQSIEQALAEPGAS